jgi:hypothetical protein
MVGGLSHILWTIKAMFETTNQLWSLVVAFIPRYTNKKSWGWGSYCGCWTYGEQKQTSPIPSLQTTLEAILNISSLDPHKSLGFTWFYPFQICWIHSSKSNIWWNSAPLFWTVDLKPSYALSGHSRASVQRCSRKSHFQTPTKPWAPVPGIEEWFTQDMDVRNTHGLPNLRDLIFWPPPQNADR